MQFSSIHHIEHEDYEFINSIGVIKNNVDLYTSSAVKCKQHHIFPCKKCPSFLSQFNERFEKLEEHKWQWVCDMCSEHNELDELQQMGYKQLKYSLNKNETLLCPLNLQEDYQMMSIQTSQKQLKKQTYIYVLDQSNSTLTTYDSIGLHENFGQQTLTDNQKKNINDNKNHQLFKRLKELYGFTDKEITDNFYKIVQQYQVQKASPLDIALSLGKISAKEVDQIRKEAEELQKRQQDGAAYFKEKIQKIRKLNINPQLNRWGIIVELVYEHLKYLKQKKECNVFFIVFSDCVQIVPPNKDFNWNLDKNIKNLYEIYHDSELGGQIFIGEFNILNINTQAVNNIDNLSLILDMLFIDVAYEGGNWNCEDIRYILQEMQPEGETSLGTALFTSLKFSKVLNSFSTQIILITDGLANKGVGSLEEIEKLRQMMRMNQGQFGNQLKEKEKQAQKFYSNLGKIARLYSCTINIFSFNDEVSDLYILNQATNQSGGVIGSIEIDVRQNVKSFTMESFAKALYLLKTIEGRKPVKISGCEVKICIQKPFRLIPVGKDESEKVQILEYNRGSFNQNDMDVFFIQREEGQGFGMKYLISCKIQFETSQGDSVQLFHMIQKEIKESIENFYSINYELVVVFLCKLLQIDNDHYFIDEFFQLYDRYGVMIEGIGQLSRGEQRVGSGTSGANQVADRADGTQEARGGVQEQIARIR